MIIIWKDPNMRLHPVCGERVTYSHAVQRHAFADILAFGSAERRAVLCIRRKRSIFAGR